jgi:adenine phosphoribosyltransferase
MYRVLGADVVNMSIATEAALAREAGIEYAVIAMSTDYDCWKQDEEPVSWRGILEIFNKNIEKVKALLLQTLKSISNEINIKAERIKQKVRTVPNWPKPGIMFRDITTLISDKEGFRDVVEILEERYKNREIDVIAGIESRGFIIGSALATKLNKGLILIRKPGKLPAEKIREEYSLEYGKDAVEIHRDAVKPFQKVLLIDDLLATGGTCLAAGNLIEKLGGQVVECAFVINLPELKGHEKLRWPVFSIIDFEGD